MSGKQRKHPVVLGILLLLLLPLLLAAVVAFVAALPFLFLYHLLLRAAVELLWGSHGKRILLVYSRSPVWQEYIERNWLPKLEPHAVILDWSDRARWKRNRPFSALVFRHWAGSVDFNPMAIVFPPFRRARKIGFFYAFRDWKHGKTVQLQRLESQLLSIAAELRGESA